jgi:hypothetical protein
LIRRSSRPAFVHRVTFFPADSRQQKGWKSVRGSFVWWCLQLRQHWWVRCDFQVRRRHRLVFRYTFPELRHRWSISLGIHSSQGWKLLRYRRRSHLQGRDDGSVLPGLDLAPTPLPRNPCNAGSERQSLRDFPSTAKLARTCFPSVWTAATSTRSPICRRRR